MIDILTPALGEGVGEAILARWLKNPGDAVSAGEGLLVLETDKASVEVAADADGVLGAIFAQAGDSVAIGSVLGRIDRQGNAP
jgi:2-oxoglutarate dehydrogenase E2 component (dihydrolipoamide succinyltransferase)